MNNLLERYFASEFECKTENSYEFFLEKYDESNGKEIERLAHVRQWMVNHPYHDLFRSFDVGKIKQEVKDQFQSP